MIAFVSDRNRPVYDFSDPVDLETMTEGDPLFANLDDRFHESCRKRGIPLGFRIPTYVACAHKRTDGSHGSVAACN